ncbi:MAG: hypothetical protein KME10_19650 [Plectolyngbya sp. WJT66-NPBG17]|jgi:hypothetical protein|nr:hypothetical protein [Plectolyngbya sp. WJT66-NPBG17]MBW4528269.1 hypothetical protein [Phormidium tanganyikae FI6-MK23]
MESNSLQDLGLALQLDFDRWRNGLIDPLRSLMQLEEISFQGLEADVEHFYELEADLFEFYDALTQDFLPGAKLSSSVSSFGADSSFPGSTERSYESLDSQGSRLLHSPGPDWTRVTEQSSLKRTESRIKPLQSVETDFARLSPISNPGRESAIDEKPEPMTTRAKSESHPLLESSSRPEYLRNSSAIEPVRTTVRSVSDHSSGQSFRDFSRREVEHSSESEIEHSSRQEEIKASSSKFVRPRVEQGSAIEFDLPVVEKGSVSQSTRPVVKMSSIKVTRPVVEKRLVSEVNRPVVEKGSVSEVTRPGLEIGVNSAKSVQNGLNEPFLRYESRNFDPSFSEAPRTLRDLATLVTASPEAIEQNNAIATHKIQSDIVFQPTSIEVVSEADQYLRSDPNLDLDTILKAVRQEINQEYRRFYGS